MPISLPFRDRGEAGRFLAERLSAYAGRSDVIVLALPRGGVPVAYEVARHLGVPFDVLLVRKLGLPGHPELAMGAIAVGGESVLNEVAVKLLAVSEAEIAAVAAREKRELKRRERAYRGDRPPPELAGRTAILVDDGLATGASMLAAIRALRHQQPARIVVAAPVGAPESCAALREEADEVVCAATPEPFHAVGLWYRDFAQTSDEEVRDLLTRGRSAGRAA